MKLADEDKQWIKIVLTTVIVAFVITASVAIAYWLSRVS